ncbi:hypothetical protein TREMEDRAFT_74911 [Tremella mesenterica DSM 1558]|uniref:uncharacterized protein n=1 Tax=Tremella mesenterica (strain ATCC 24925 / CBS 8224 / DSM 1558 / NBRC 9311 / NRRL Y-6157 / RJB 2259-6 / UBC 559-6) TaxID=578456 RepID=UPI00032D61F5|nr:uncharacterized protein TREMEDRAFT_74911 [Tremella mesenterica DSM 1558]EIW65753.1 hypothetical protein TREMEDRAFT_74911 [Tremella mesenterica DSM 1558]
MSVCGEHEVPLPPHSDHVTTEATTTATPVRYPPYTPPPDVIYPPDSVPNPHVGVMDEQPVYDPFPAGSLYRPRLIPHDMDERIDKRSVWIAVDKSDHAVYFLLPSCLRCSSPSIAQLCDRSRPHCGRCAGKNIPCEYGTYWSLMKLRSSLPVKKRKSEIKPSKLQQVTTPDPHEEPSPPILETELVTETVVTENRSTKVRKKARRLSESPSPPPTIPTNSVYLKRQIRPIVPKLHDDEGDPEAYAKRVRVNATKPPLRTRGECPVWAETWEDLNGIAHFAELVRTEGGRISIARGGMARGVVLSGQAPGLHGWWSVEEKVGSVVVSLGQSRKPYAKDQEGEESGEIEALLKAHRARSPLALAVSHDYSAIPVHIPKPIIVLGWFWVTDAWLEPEFNNFTPTSTKSAQAEDVMRKVRWKIHFEYCAGQSLPWWTTIFPVSLPIPTDNGLWSTSDVGLFGSQTVVRSPPVRVSGVATIAQLLNPIDDTPPNAPPSACTRQGRARLKEEAEKATHRCETCNSTTRRVYEHAEMCLNESCPEIFKDVSHSNQLGPPDNVPARVRAETRLDPLNLRLDFRTKVSDVGYVVRETAGKEYWAPSLCAGCGRANSTVDTLQPECGVCGEQVRRHKKVWSAAELRAPMRPICTGQRQDSGFPTWPTK